MEAVADDNFAAFEGGADDLTHELSAAGGEEEEFGFGDESMSFRGVLQKVSYLVTGNGAAGFAGCEAGVAGFAQPRGEAADLRGFAAALGALESDK